MALRVVVAAVLGGVVGYDRAAANKPAGVRTHAIVSAGAALFVGIGSLVSSQGQERVPLVDGRVLAGVITGVGFLGAGTIIRREGSVRGLSTAAGVWVVAGIGATVALGYWWLGVLTSLLIIAIQASSYLDKFPANEGGGEKESEKHAAERPGNGGRAAEDSQTRAPREND